MIDDRTAELDLPLPNEENNLSDDVGRLREAFNSIDTYLKMASDVADAALPANQKGAPDGVAPLVQGRVPMTYMPEALVGSVKYQGTWNAATNTPAIPAAAAANRGWYFLVSVGGATSISGQSKWVAGDWIVSNGGSWDRIANSEVFDASAIQSGVFDAARIPNLAIAKITGLQQALNDLQSGIDSKLDAAGGAVTGATESTTPTTGALRLAGGLGVAKNINAGGAINSAGNVSAFSDARLKQDVEQITGAIEKVMQLRGVTYTDIATEERRTGLIAQELQKVLPEAVVAQGEYLAVAYGNLAGLLVEAVKALAARVDELERS